MPKAWVPVSQRLVDGQIDFTRLGDADIRAIIGMKLRDNEPVVRSLIGELFNGALAWGSGHRLRGED
ncbi:MAG: hypothetical protein AB2728_11200 [Candidatus Thiodiazotropha sp.]